jgi:SnoaL-like protein
VSSQLESTTVDERLAAMLDRHEIQEVLLRYCRGMDRHDAPLARSAYHDDARDDHGPYIGSGSGLVEWANALHTQAMSAHQHYITNTLIELEGDSAHAETYYLMAAVKRGTSETVMGGGRYLDRLERRGGRWGIVERICTAEWFDDPALLEDMLALGAEVSQDASDPSYRRPLAVERDDRIAFGPGSAVNVPL